MLHKQEGNQQATKAKLVTRATTQAQYMNEVNTSLCMEIENQWDEQC